MSIPTLPLRANSELVAVAAIKALLGWTSDVGTELPSPESWSDQCFVLVAPVGGTPDVYTPQEHPVVDVKCFARPMTTSRRPPWPVAASVAAAIRAGCTARLHQPLNLVLPPGYPNAFVHALYVLTTPRRVPGDDSAYAVYSLDMQLHWTPVGA